MHYDVCAYTAFDPEPHDVTSRHHLVQGQPNRLWARLPAIVALVVIAAGVAGCGRKGPPEFDSGQPVAKAQTNELVPGLNVPHKSADTEKPRKPKGNFILDPLL
jgi:predicted small lipoprotein YifL